MNERQERVKRQGRETFRGAFDDGATARRRAFPAGGRRNLSLRVDDEIMQYVGGEGAVGAGRGGEAPRCRMPPEFG